MLPNHNYTIPTAVPRSIFRAYDIRGIAEDELTLDTVYALGLAIGTEAHHLGQKRIVVARDGRISSPFLFTALFDGLIASGRHVIDIGMCPTPLLYFATHWLKTHAGVMLTGSHNPGNYNGLKIVLAGTTLAESAIQTLYERITKNDFVKGIGTFELKDVTADYIERIARDVHLEKPLKIVVDAANGVTGHVAPELFRRLGCEVVPLFCEIDGYFPNHGPDPASVENLNDLKQAVLLHKADLGLAFDGDGDRLGLLSDTGKIIWPDRQLMLLAQDVLSRNPGAEVIFDVKSSRHLPEIIEKAGGKALMWKTGHSLIKSKMQEQGALLAGEMSGHIFFKEKWYGFDDALYAAARLLEIISRDTRSVTEIFSALPESVSTPEIKITVPEDKKLEIMQKILDNVHFEDAHINTTDGLRAEFPDGWGLIRTSNTTPCLTLRFEANDNESMLRIQELFRALLHKVDEKLSF